MKLKNGGVKMDNIKRKLDEALRRAEDRAFANVIGPVIVVGGTLEKGPVCVMFKGPAGSGKTSIIREWAREHSEEINFVELDVPKLSVQYVEDMPVVFSTDEIERMASEAVLMPARARFSEVSTVTGDGVSVSVRRNSEPVTTISSTCVWSLPLAAGAAVCAAAWLAPSTATAAPQIMVEASSRSRTVFLIKVNSPASLRRACPHARSRILASRTQLAGSYELKSNSGQRASGAPDFNAPELSL